MTIKIDRFEAKEIIKPANVQLENLNTILINDREEGKVISFIQLCNDKNKNKELASRIITAIEEYILENGGNESENQD